jgi:hypothetical protein
MPQAPEVDEVSRREVLVEEASDDESSTSDDESSADSSDGDYEPNATTPPPPACIPRESSSSTKKSKRSKKPNNSISSTQKNSSPTKAKWEMMNDDQIRKNALNLLQASPCRSGNSSGNGNAAVQYQSYQDTPPAGARSASSSNPPWAQHDNNSYNNNNNNSSISSIGGTPYDSGEVLMSVSQVASMAFGCMAHCLTEGYRAASNYYSGYQQNQSEGGGNATYNYQHVSSSPYNDIGGGSGGMSNNNSNANNNSYSGGYQTPVGGYQSQRREVMDRGVPQSPATANKSSGHGTEQTVQQSAEEASLKQGTASKAKGPSFQQSAPVILEARGEYATVSLPSTYQGRK